MTTQKQPFEDASPVRMVDFPVSPVSFQLRNKEPQNKNGRNFGDPETPPQTAPKPSPAKHSSIIDRMLQSNETLNTQIKHKE